MKKSKDKLQWFVRGAIGCSLIGFGLCATIESAFLKHQAPENTLWILYGTISLIIFMSGINILISALPYAKNSKRKNEEQNHDEAVKNF